jgi:hypothetical protein
MKKLELLFLKTSFRCHICEKKLQPKILIKLFLEYFSRLFEVKIEKYDFHFGVNRQSINEKFDRAQMKSEKKLKLIGFRFFGVFTFYSRFLTWKAFQINFG